MRRAYRRATEVFASPLEPEFAEAGPRSRRRCSPISARASTAPGIATASPRFMGYIPGGGLFHSALGDFLAAASNKYSGFASAAPGAARLENAMPGWLAERHRLSRGSPPAR